MPETWEILKYAGILAACVVMVFVVKARRKQYQQHIAELADAETCEHLKPVLEEMRRRGHAVRLVRQGRGDEPMEIFLTPQFDAKTIYEELKLQPPAHLSERGVIYCEECWCEISGVAW